MRSLDYLSELEQIRRVSRNGNMIEHITQPSLKVQIAAVESMPTSIKYIDAPAIEVQLIAVRLSEFALREIAEPNLSVQLASVQANGHSIRHLYDPLPMIQTAACIEHPHAINSIKPIESIDISLLKKYRDILAPKQRERLKSIENPVTETRTVIENNFKNPNGWSDEEQMEWIKRGGTKRCSSRFSKILNPSLAVQLVAAQLNGEILIYIENPAPLIQTVACNNFPRAINFIYPIESIDISLLKKYKPYLYKKQRARLESIENQITESYDAKDINTWSDEKKISWILENGPIVAVARFSRFTNPGLVIQLAVVQKNGRAIEFIDCPSPMIQAVACRENPHAISVIHPIESIDITLLKKYKKYLTKVQKAHLKSIERLITESYDVNDPNTWSEEKQIEWIRDGGYLSTRLRRLNNPSEKVVIAALTEDPYELEYIVNPSLVVQLFAVKQQGKAIRFIKNQLPMLQWAAIKQNAYSIRHMTNPIEDVQLYAVSEDASLINEIANPTPKVIDFMREQYGYEYKRS